jgi:hypothetical protein
MYCAAEIDVVELEDWSRGLGVGGGCDDREEGCEENETTNVHVSDPIVLGESRRMVEAQMGKTRKEPGAQGG